MKRTGPDLPRALSAEEAKRTALANVVYMLRRAADVGDRYNDPAWASLMRGIKDGLSGEPPMSTEENYLRAYEALRPR